MGDDQRDIDARIEEMLKAGGSYREILKELSCTKNQISAARMKLGIYQDGTKKRRSKASSRRSPKQVAAAKRKAIEMLKAGESYKEIHRQTGLYSNTVAELKREINEASKARKSKWHGPRKKLTVAERADAEAEARRLFAEGADFKDVQKAVGLTPHQLKGVRDELPSSSLVLSVHSAETIDPKFRDALASWMEANGIETVKRLEGGRLSITVRKEVVL